MLNANNLKTRDSNVRVTDKIRSDVGQQNMISISNNFHQYCALDWCCIKQSAFHVFFFAGLCEVTLKQYSHVIA